MVERTLGAFEENTVGYTTSEFQIADIENQLILAAANRLPNLLWLVHHGFPFLEFERNSRASGSRILRGPLSFLVDRACIMNPVLTPPWLLGLVWFFTKGGQTLRPIGIATLAVILLLLGMKAKNYYVSPVYPVLFANGAVFLERLSARHAWIRAACPVYILVSGCALAPLVMPISVSSRISCLPPLVARLHAGEAT